MELKHNFHEELRLCCSCFVCLLVFYSVVGGFCLVVGGWGQGVSYLV